jgi:hypothetical protein
VVVVANSEEAFVFFDFAVFEEIGCEGLEGHGGFLTVDHPCPDVPSGRSPPRGGGERGIGTFGAGVCL